jgi:hypothetical protein
MSNDVATRLRKWRTEWDWRLPDEAADEIERLRGEIISLQEQLREASRMSDYWYQQNAR